MSKIFATLTAALFSLPSLAANEVSFEDLERAYKKGICDRKLDSFNFDKRDVSLVFLQDVLYGISGLDSYTKRFVGDYNVFIIGRDIDPVFDRLYQYAQRSDVRQQIKEDYNSMEAAAGAIFKRHGEASSKDVDFIIFIMCENYKMLSGRDFEMKSELEKYSNSLNSRILNKNINRLQDLTKDFE